MITAEFSLTQQVLDLESRVRWGPKLIQFTAFITILITGTDSRHPISFPCHNCFSKNQWNWNLRASYVSVKSNDGLYSFDLLKCSFIWFDIYSYRKNMLLWLIKILIFQNLPGYYSLGDHNPCGEMWVE